MLLNFGWNYSGAILENVEFLLFLNIVSVILRYVQQNFFAVVFR